MATNDRLDLFFEQVQHLCSEYWIELIPREGYFEIKSPYENENGLKFAKVQNKYGWKWERAND